MREFKVTDESNSNGPYFVIRERAHDDLLGEIWEMVGWSSTLIGAAKYARSLCVGDDLIEEFHQEHDQ